MTALLARWTEKLAGGPQAGTSDSYSDVVTLYLYKYALEARWCRVDGFVGNVY